MLNSKTSLSSKIPSIGAATTELVAVLQKHAIPLYVFAGFALYLHGLEDKADDGDIRILHPNLFEVAAMLREELPGKHITMRGTRPYQSGLHTYTNDCIEVDDGAAELDICSHMTVDCDLGTFTFPYSTKAFDDVVDLSFGGHMLPVASVEFLLLYYLTLRRGAVDGKSDEARIRRILTSGKLDHAKFLALIKDMPQADQLLQLYTARLPK